MDQILQLLKDAFAAKGIRRALWSFLIIGVLIVCVEARTNYFEIGAISKRLDALEKVAKEPLPSDQKMRVEKLKGEILGELEGLQAKRAHPLNQFGAMLLRFVKGTWITIPLFWLVFKISFFFYRENKSEDLRVRGMLLYWFGWLGLSAATWITTMLGVISVMWNTSQSALTSWIVFPFCSAGVCILVAVWAVLLRALLPKENRTEAKPAATVQAQPS